MPNRPFVAQDAAATLLNDNASNFSRDKAKQKIVRTFDPQSLTECGRKLSYLTTITDGKEHKLNLTNEESLANRYTKIKWIDILGNLKDIRVLDSWVVACDIGYNLVTKVDCVIQMDSLDELQSVVSIKSASSDEFKKIQDKGPHRKDIVAIMTDMWLIEIAHGIIIYENRDNLEFMINSILPERAIINSVKSKAKELYHHKINGTIPNQPYKDKSSKECSNCEFSKRCWE